MKGFNVSKKILVGFGIALAILSALLIFLSTRANITLIKLGDSLYIQAIMMVIYSFLSAAGSVWMFVKAFEEDDNLFFGSSIIGLLVGFFCLVYGTYSDTHSTGPFGIMGIMLILITVAYAVVYMYKTGKRLACTVLEVITLVLSIVFLVATINLLRREHVVKEAFVLAFIPLGFGLAAGTALFNRFIKKGNPKRIKLCIIAGIVLGLFGYSLGVAAALVASPYYPTVFKLPIAFVATQLTDSGIVLFHTDFAGESVYITDYGMKHDFVYSKFVDKYFMDVWNFSGSPINKTWHMQ